MSHFDMWLKRFAGEQLQALSQRELDIAYESYVEALSFAIKKYWSGAFEDIQKEHDQVII